MHRRRLPALVTDARTRSPIGHFVTVLHGYSQFSPKDLRQAAAVFPDEWQTKYASEGRLRMNELASPELSVIISTRNRPEKLRRAVASVLENSVSNFELIVVDQSTDQLSAEFMATFGDDRIRYLRTPPVD